MKVFIPGAGGKVQHILNLKELPGVSEVIVSDIYPWAYGNFVADRAYELPPFANPNFFTEFEAVHQRETFDVCIPLHDASLVMFSRNRERFGELNLPVAMNPSETIELVADKLATYHFFREHGFPTPVLFALDEFQTLAQRPFPCFIKPRYIEARGTARQLFMKIEDEADLEYVLRRVAGREADFLVQEFVDGAEINIDFFCDQDGAVQSIVPVERQAMGMSRGITRGRILPDRRFDPHIHEMAAKLRFWGANQVQAFVRDDESIQFMEINGRLSGSSVLVKQAGVNYFDYLIRLIKGEPVQIREQPAELRMSCWEHPHFYTESPMNRLETT